MKNRIWLGGLVLGILFLLGAEAVAAAGPNDQCLACHGVQGMTMMVGAEKVPIYVDAAAFAQGNHAAANCTDCHAGLNPTPPHNAKRIYGSWARFSVKDTDTSKTRNYYTVAASACLKCHTDSRFAAFLKSDHATIKDLKMTPDGHPRVERKVKGSDGKEYSVDENFAANDCERCHMQTNCGTCHWNAPVLQKTMGNILERWTDYSKDADTLKGGQSEFALDWTFNVEKHDFRSAAELAATNDVCMACHIGYYQGDKTIAAINVFGMGVRRHPQLEELILSWGRGVHETKQFCTDCHKELHDVAPRTTEHGKRVGGNTQCTDCHADRKLTALHADVNCVACHDAELTTVQRDSETNTVEPVAVKHSLSESWPSHNLTLSVKCDKCHTAGNPLGVAASVTPITIHAPASTSAGNAPTVPVTGSEGDGTYRLLWLVFGAGLGLAGLGLYLVVSQRPR